MRSILAAMFALSALPALAEDDATPWIASARSSARLVAAGPINKGVYTLAIEVALKPGTITYWRSPGDAGVPPVATFEGSDNLAKVELLFPAPRRIAEAGGVEAFGYETGVAFPLLATPRDASKPLRLAFQFAYAACEKICVPASAAGQIELAPNAAIAAHAGLVDAALRKVPRLLAADAATIVADGSGWTLAIKQAQDVFAEGPEGWSFATRPGPAPGSFVMELTDRPREDGLRKVPVRLTAVGADWAAELVVPIDVPAPRH